MTRNRRIGKRMAVASAAAVTLVELLTAAGIAAIVAAVSLPTMAGVTQGYRLRTAAWQLAGDLRLTRQKAVSTNRRHRVCFSNCGDPVPAEGYLIQREDGSRWVIDAAVQPRSRFVQLTSNTTMTFTEMGEAAGGTVTLVSGSSRFQVRTHYTGKITVCLGSCS